MTLRNVLDWNLGILQGKDFYDGGIVRREWMPPKEKYEQPNDGRREFNDGGS